MPEAIEQPGIVTQAVSAAINDAKAVGDSPSQAVGTDGKPVESQGTESPGIQLPEFMQGQIDPGEYAKLTPEQQLSKVAEWGKSVYTNAQKKNQEAADLRKSLEPLSQLQADLDADPKRYTHLKQADADYRSGRTQSATAVTGESRLSGKLETMLAKTPEDQRSEQRDTMRLLAEGVGEQLGISELKESLEQLNTNLGHMVTNTTQSRRESLTQELQALPKAFKPLVEKYQVDILALGTTASGNRLGPMQLLQFKAEPEELRTAILAQERETPSQQKSTERTKANSTTAPVQTTGVEGLVKETDVVKSTTPAFGDQTKIGNLVNRLLPGLRKTMPTPGA